MSTLTADAGAFAGAFAGAGVGVGADADAGAGAGAVPGVDAGAGESRFCERLSVTFGLGPPSLIRGPLGSLTFSFASVNKDWKWSLNSSASLYISLPVSL